MRYSSHQCPVLRAHRDVLQTAYTQGGGETTGEAQLQEQDIPSFQSGHVARYRQQERCFRPDNMTRVPPPLEEHYQQIIPQAMTWTWTTTTATQTTFCMVFARTLPGWNLLPMLLLTTSQWAAFQTMAGDRTVGVEQRDHQEEHTGPSCCKTTASQTRGRACGGCFAGGRSRITQQPVSPAEASLEISLAESQPLQHRQYYCLEAMPVVTRATTAVETFVRRNAINRK